jgi:hypothetical protein
MGTESLCSSCINHFTQKFIHSNNVRTKSYCIIDKNNAIYNVTECSHHNTISPSDNEIRSIVNKMYEKK